MPRLITSALWISLGIFLGRLAGFVREVGLAAKLGVTPEADVAVVLLTVPDALTNLLMGGALSAILIPRFKKLGAGIRADALFCKGSLVVGGGFALIAVLASYRADWLLALLAPGLDDVTTIKAEELLSLVIWVVPLTALAGVSTAYLQAHGRFFVPAMGTLVFNVVVIFFIAFGLDDWGLSILVIGIMFGAVLRWGSQLSRIRWRRGFSWRAVRWRLLGKGFGRRYLQAVAGGGLITLLPVLARAFASNNGEGSLALFSYAYKLVEFPLGVCVTVFSAAFFPILSQAFARGDDPSAGLAKVSRWMLAISFSLATILWAFNSLFTQLAFGYGKIGPAQVEAIGWLFAIGVISLPLQGGCALLSSVFYAKSDTTTPLWISLGAFLGFIPLGYVFARMGGPAGVMSALVALYAVLFSFQTFLLSHYHKLSLWHLLSLKRVAFLVIVASGAGVALRYLATYMKLFPVLGLAVAAVAAASLLVIFLVCMGDKKNLVQWLSCRET
ncbi:MAG: oligosaccharide flippase family protein [Gammaproteobacteria bacterium]|nr:oligosaccharide flippase family protein [Gammaproteobacteria bacterium]MBU1804128.1 oligosaccharide flippase family protein [Gammaproteobacteria bacterium]